MMSLGLKQNQYTAIGLKKPNAKPEELRQRVYLYTTKKEPVKKG